MLGRSITSATAHFHIAVKIRSVVEFKLIYPQSLSDSFKSNESLATHSASRQLTLYDAHPKCRNRHGMVDPSGLLPDGLRDPLIPGINGSPPWTYPSSRQKPAALTMLPLFLSHQLPAPHIRPISPSCTAIGYALPAVNCEAPAE